MRSGELGFAAYNDGPTFFEGEIVEKIRDSNCH